jgi:hypothetical protein
MIASIALERRGVPMDQAAQVSIARFSNTGPEAFFMLLLARESMEWLLRMLMALLIITSLASQFTSTLLLSDMVSGPVISFAENMTTSYDKPYLTYADADYNNPTQFETFAEYSEDGANTEGVDDTGIVLRAFLPIAQQQIRQSLHRYEGLSYIYDAHVLCVRPVFEELRFCDTDTSTGIYSRVCGVIKPEPGLLDSLNVMESLTPLHFSCWIVLHVGSWQPCWLKWPGMTPINDVLYPLSYKEQLRYGAQTGGTHLFWYMSHNGSVDDTMCYYNDTTAAGRTRCGNETIDLFSLNKSGPWLQANGTSANGTNLFLKASICFDSV